MQHVFTATKNRIYHMVQIKRVSLTEKFIICLINKYSFIFLTQTNKTEFSQLH